MTNKLKSPSYATIVDDKVRIVIGVKCNRYYCRESGCDFPSCANLSDEEFDTIEEAREKFPDLILV